MRQIPYVSNTLHAIDPVIITFHDLDIRFTIKIVLRLSRRLTYFFVGKEKVLNDMHDTDK